MVVMPQIQAESNSTSGSSQKSKNEVVAMGDSVNVEKKN